MHFRQYLHRTHFILRTDHKPLEWLATVSDANGRRGRWIDLLQDFSFKILHRLGMKHTNVDALSRNPVGRRRTMMNSAKKSEMSVLKEVTQLPWQEVCSLSSVAGDHNGLV